MNRYGRGGRKTFEQKQKRARKFEPSNERLYLAFFKPFNVVTQFTPPENDQQESLANFDFPKDVYPVGRLDSDSEGLLILSDDSRLNNALLDPENEHERTYWVQVDNEATEEALDELRRGVVVQGRMTKPCRAHRINGEPDLPPRTVPIRIRKNIPTSWISLTLTEGKNRQVRRMTAAVGHPTLRLVRWSIGSLTLGDLKLAPGEWTELNLEEVRKLFG
ncbi:pseudouridine synthase [Candidatus Obscuribacterales bacterium]|nr:pseudouridine synthase [Candidatus Obscuribacterales bacterium]MBX3150850.1 pseudouridine synthase [Candidatus Obscuribacterales bacterium]